MKSCDSNNENGEYDDNALGIPRTSTVSQFAKKRDEASFKDANDTS